MSPKFSFTQNIAQPNHSNWPCLRKRPSKGKRCQQNSKHDQTAPFNTVSPGKIMETPDQVQSFCDDVFCFDVKMTMSSNAM